MVGTVFSQEMIVKLIENKEPLNKSECFSYEKKATVA